jgi:hypothetical protein
LSSGRHASAQTFTPGLEIDDITFDTSRLFRETVEVGDEAEHRHDRQICGLAHGRESGERLALATR